jgi:small subunit ribosomal protein S5
MGLISDRKTSSQLFQPYTTEEKLLLAKKYTPEQMEAIEAGEKAIKPNDLKEKGVMRSDLGTVQYIEDFSRTRSLLDRPQKYNGPIDPNIRFMTPGESNRARQKTWEEYGQEKKAWEALKPNGSKEESKSGQDDHFVPEDRLDDLKTRDREPWFVGTDGKFIPREQTPMAFAPGLPKRFSDEEEAAQEKGEEDDVDPRDPDGVYDKLIKSTGLTLDQIFDYNVRILVRHRVVNQTRLGKIASTYCLAIAGNGNGRLGLGEAKGQEVEETSANARIKAIRSMQPIPRYENRTIFGDVEGKVSAVELKLMSRPPGTFYTLYTSRLHANITRIWSTLPAFNI